MPANYRIVRDTDACSTHGNSIVLSAPCALSIYTQLHFPWNLTEVQRAAYRRWILLPACHTGKLRSRKATVGGSHWGALLVFLGAVAGTQDKTSKMHVREKRRSRRKAEGKQQKALAREYFEAEKSICEDRRQKNAFAAAWQESDSEGDSWEKHGKGMGGKHPIQAGRAGGRGHGQAGSARRYTAVRDSGGENHLWPEVVEGEESSRNNRNIVRSEKTGNKPNCMGTGAGRASCQRGSREKGGFSRRGATSRGWRDSPLHVPKGSRSRGDPGLSSTATQTKRLQHLTRSPATALAESQRSITAKITKACYKAPLHKPMRSAHITCTSAAWPESL